MSSNMSSRRTDPLEAIKELAYRLYLIAAEPDAWKQYQITSEDRNVVLDRLQNSIDSYVLEAQKELKALHAQYAHEGGKPQIMTVDILKRWIAAIDVPIMTDIYQTNAPNVFYATFALPLQSEHFSQLRALNIQAIDPHSTLRNRYMLKWQPPRNEEA